jgi:hypothetical protein
VAGFMATFYLLPSPGFLGQSLAQHLQGLFPGLNWDESALAHVAEQVTQAAARHANVYLVHQHEMPQTEDVLQVLVDGYGAEPGDEIIEIHAGARLGEWRIERHVVRQAA